MKKIIIAFCLCLFLITGCKNNIDDLKKEINQNIKTMSIDDIIDRLDKSLNNIFMFPSSEYEDEFIYYVESIRDNINRFDNDELSKIYTKLQIDYDFQYNSLKYNKNMYENDLEKIHDKITKDIE